MALKVTFPRSEAKVFDADGFFIINGTLTLYQEATSVDVGIEPEILELFDVHPRSNQAVAAFPKGEWTSCYEIDSSTAVQ